MPGDQRRKAGKLFQLGNSFVQAIPWLFLPLIGVGVGMASGRKSDGRALPNGIWKITLPSLVYLAKWVGQNSLKENYVQA